MVSVYDKTGVVSFAAALAARGVEIVSTGGTAKALRDAGIEVREVSAVTGFPEIMGGRVKTLHPGILAGILADSRTQRHLDEIAELGIAPVDMVVCNLYPFQAVVAQPETSLDEAIENIDIGGVTLIRAAAKNFESVACVVNHHRYKDILDELAAHDGMLTRDTRFDLAREAFLYTADYDEAIYEYLRGDGAHFTDLMTLHFEKVEDLRYGENPHQHAAFYRELFAPPSSVARARQLHGKALSFNNILDMDAAWRAVSEFHVPAVVVVKHTNPCGVALGSTVHDAYERAYGCDPQSAFGGIVAINREVDKGLAGLIGEVFYEIIIAPAYHEEALEVLTEKKNLRIIYMGEESPRLDEGFDMKRVSGGLLVQDYDTSAEDRSQMTVPTAAHPTHEQWEDLLFAWRVAKHVKSNAIVLVRDLATVGIGAGQMSRVDSARIAVMKAGERCDGAVVASDAFFPFRDAVDELREHGVTAIIQPGGSIRDAEVIEAADEHGLPMVLTGVRHFRH